MSVLIRALTYATLFIGFVLVFLPARALSAAGVARPAALAAPQLAGMIVGAAGAALALACILTFVLRGRGTPAPFDPPRRLVVSGPYRYLRNPMYLGAGLALAGAALFYQALVLWAYAGGFLLLMHAFVVAYEEPTLRRTFGEDYESYCREVRRWLPKGIGPVLGSAVFFVVAPGVVAGWVPYAITRWRMEPPLVGLPATRWIGAALVLAGSAVLLESFARFALVGKGTPAPVRPLPRSWWSPASTGTCATRCTWVWWPPSSARPCSSAAPRSSCTRAWSGPPSTSSCWDTRSPRCSPVTATPTVSISARCGAGGRV